MGKVSLTFTGLNILRYVFTNVVGLYFFTIRGILILYFSNGYAYVLNLRSRSASGLESLLDITASKPTLIFYLDKLVEVIKYL